MAFWLRALLLTTFALNAWSGPLVAQERYEVRELFRKGSWYVELTHDTTDGSLWCSAETANRNGQTFSITGYDSDGFSVFVMDPNWNISERPLRFLVDIDYSRWTMDGRGSGIAVSISPESRENAAKFVSEVMSGNAIAVMNSDKRRLAVFSLSGSHAAVSQFMECWSQIKSPSLGTRSDPFMGTSDPFN